MTELSLEQWTGIGTAAVGGVVGLIGGVGGLWAVIRQAKRDDEKQEAEQRRADIETGMKALKDVCILQQDQLNNLTATASKQQGAIEQQRLEIDEHKQNHQRCEKKYLELQSKFDNLSGDVKELKNGNGKSHE